MDVGQVFNYSQLCQSDSESITLNSLNSVPYKLDKLYFSPISAFHHTCSNYTSHFCTNLGHVLWLSGHFWLLKSLIKFSSNLNSPINISSLSLQYLDLTPALRSLGRDEHRTDSILPPPPAPPLLAPTSQGAGGREGGMEEEGQLFPPSLETMVWSTPGCLTLIRHSAAASLMGLL